MKTYTKFQNLRLFIFPMMQGICKICLENNEEDWGQCASCRKYFDNYICVCPVQGDALKSLGSGNYYGKVLFFSLHFAF